jgi:hypothetical protein
MRREGRLLYVFDARRVCKVNVSLFTRLRQAAVLLLLHQLCESEKEAPAARLIMCRRRLCVGQTLGIFCVLIWYMLLSSIAGELRWCDLLQLV